VNQGLFRRGWIRLGVACHVRSGLAMLFNHARAGTGLDQRQRRGMSRGRFGCGSFCRVASRREKTTTRSARFRLRRRMVGCITEWCGGLMLCMARHSRVG
jgi:hypothetical protein